MTHVDVDLDERTDLRTTEDGDHEKFAHVVVPASAVTEAYISGTPVTALCGKTWVPTRDPGRYPVCPTCKEILEMARATRGGGSGGSGSGEGQRGRRRQPRLSDLAHTPRGVRAQARQAHLAAHTCRWPLGPEPLGRGGRQGACEAHWARRRPPGQSVRGRGGVGPVMRPSGRGHPPASSKPRTHP